MKILIIEDDRTIREYLGRELVNWGYEVFLQENFQNPIEDFDKIKPDLVLLDVILPSRNGYFWCQEIRKISNVPIVFISSKNEALDIVTGMQAGGDNYITKPFDLYVVRAKVEAILRRTYDFSDTKKYEFMSQEYGLIELDCSRGLLVCSAGDSVAEPLGPIVGEAAGQSARDSAGRLARHSAGEPLGQPAGQIVREPLGQPAGQIDLTKTEMMILQELINAKGGFVSRQAIIEACWQGEDFIDDNTLAVNVARLRKKLKNMGLENLIITKKGVGYGLR